MPITFFVRKIGPVHVAEPGLTAGRWQVADKIQVNLEIFNNHCSYIERLDFLLRLTKVQQDLTRSCGNARKKELFLEDLAKVFLLGYTYIHTQMCTHIHT